jgi:hypothetical protein
MRRKITNETWEQIKTGYAAGVGLREIARKMNIPDGPATPCELGSAAVITGFTAHRKYPVNSVSEMRGKARRFCPKSLTTVKGSERGKRRFCFADAMQPHANEECNKLRGKARIHGD